MPVRQPAASQTLAGLPALAGTDIQSGPLAPNGGRVLRRARRTEPKKTRLQEWLRREGLTSARLEDASGIGRQSMTETKAGRRDVRLSTMKRILHGARKLANRRVAVEELFDFDSDD